MLWKHIRAWTPLGPGSAGGEVWAKCCAEFLACFELPFSRAFLVTLHLEEALPEIMRDLLGSLAAVGAICSSNNGKYSSLFSELWLIYFRKMYFQSIQLIQSAIDPNPSSLPWIESVRLSRVWGPIWIHKSVGLQFDPQISLVLEDCIYLVTARYKVE